MPKTIWRKIPAINPVDGWKELPIAECGEPLVPLGPWSQYPQILTTGIYASERDDSPYSYGQLDGALLTAFVREGVAKKLAKAASLLPRWHMLLVQDAFRPLEVQRALFDHHFAVLLSRGLEQKEATQEAQRLVSIPSDDPRCPPPHYTGGAVDVTLVTVQEEPYVRLQARIKAEMGWAEGMDYLRIIRMQSRPVLMGTTFDEGSPPTATRYYEERNQMNLSVKQRQIRDNRRLLYGVMTESGFSNYAEEWWHYDSGNQFDAARTGRSAIYGPAQFSPENREHEEMRRSRYSAEQRSTSQPRAASL